MVVLAVRLTPSVWLLPLLTKVIGRVEALAPPRNWMPLFISLGSPALTEAEGRTLREIGDGQRLLVGRAGSRRGDRRAGGVGDQAGDGRVRGGGVDGAAVAAGPGGEHDEPVLGGRDMRATASVAVKSPPNCTLIKAASWSSVVPAATVAVMVLVP